MVEKRCLSVVTIRMPASKPIGTALEMSVGGGALRL